MKTRRAGLLLLVSLGLLAPTGCGEGLLLDGEEEAASLAPEGNPDLDTEALEEEDGEPEPGQGERSALAVGTAILDAEELAFLSRINAHRAAAGKSKLRVSIALTRASIYHSTDMANKNYFSHTSADGTSFATRVKRYYNYNTYLGENIARGQLTGEIVFNAWKGSPGHNANMLNGNFTVIGIARVLSASGVPYWTTDFGGKTDAILSAGLSTLISNAGFESPASVTKGVAFQNVRTLNRWHTWASTGGSSTIRAGSNSAGSYGLRLSDPDPGSAAATQLVLAAPNVSYQLTVDTRRISGATQPTAYLDFINSSFSRIKAVTVNAGLSTGWQTVSVGELAPAGTRYVRVIMWGHSTSGHRSVYDFDVVRLTAF